MKENSIRIALLFLSTGLVAGFQNCSNADFATQASTQSDPIVHTSISENSALDGSKGSSLAVADPSTGGGALVYQLYKEILLREPDLGGYQYWSKLIQSPGGCVTVARAIVNSDESRAVDARRLNSSFIPDSRVLIRSLYRGLLAREPDVGGLDYWVAVRAVQGRDSLTAGIINSGEFAARCRSLGLN